VDIFFRGDAGLFFLDVGRLRAALALDDIEFHTFALFQRLEPFFLNGRIVNEHILPVLIGNETVPFFRVEPFHCTVQSGLPPSHVIARRPFAVRTDPFIVCGDGAGFHSGEMMTFFEPPGPAWYNMGNFQGRGAIKVMKKIEIYKRDKWNMMHAEVQGRTIIVREISDQWGEDSHVFNSRQELMNWAERRFSPERFEGSEEERLRCIGVLESI